MSIGQDPRSSDHCTCRDESVGLRLADASFGVIIVPRSTFEVAPLKRLEYCPWPSGTRSAVSIAVNHRAKDNILMKF